MIIKSLDKLKLYPVTIIGTGPASLTLALELEEKKIPCLILEAGSFERTENSQDFYKGYSGGENSYLQPYITRSRMYGGTSYQWSGLSDLLMNMILRNGQLRKTILIHILRRQLKF